MKKSFIKVFIMAAIAIFSTVGGFAAENKADAASVERYAIYIGSNIGGNNRQLLYAGTDAMAFQNTMADIGGIRKSNSVLLLDPAKDDVDNAMEYISQLIVKNKFNAKRSEFVFYYSGHSDENALLLGNNTYDYSSLKAAITKVPSDVHVVILDSCYSGNFIRTKGGQKQKPFLVDDSSVIKGHAYLSSSSSQEFSQESDEIGSSFFTNAMITGLKGAADSSGDKKVTLNELYSYAFSETLSRTENSSAGPQHPNYNITLVGSGDLVLSDISGSDCILTLSKELNGRVIIRDKNEKLVSEISKTQAAPVYLAMEEGQYGVTVISEKVTLQGSFKLGAKKSYVLSDKNLSPVTRTANRFRGEELKETDESENTEKTETYASDNTLYVPFVFSFFDNEFYRNTGKDIVTNFAVGLFRSEVYQADGVMMSFIANQTTVLNGAQFAYIFNTADKMSGAQAAGIFSYAKEVEGAQASGILNYAENVKGVQAAGCVNIADDVRYCQAAGLVNVASGKITGAQGAGLISYAGTVDGVQGSGIGNVSLFDVDGVQGAGIFNFAGGNVDGIQGAGIFNIAVGDIDGLQCSSIANYAHSVDGAQIGLVNICTGDVDGFQFGFVNYSRNGIFEFGMSYTTNTNMRFTFTSGNKRLYSVIGCQTDVDHADSDSEDNYAELIFGLGTRIEAGMFNFDFEVLGNETIMKDESDKVKNEFYPSAKFAVGFNPAKSIQIFAGAMASFEFDGNRDSFARKRNNLTVEFSDSDVKMHPEFEFGVKFSLH
ncbi:MAG: caspase family protein [Treponema sp.]|nr:caspase family protein [Candidatus Treponema equi]